MSDETSLAPYVGANPIEMAARLDGMKAALSMTQRFFSEVMEQGTDYGVIPGTQKPTLLKPGAEKLAELYGYAITVPEVREEQDRESGFYRAVVTVRLVARSSGITIADGVGEANTYEGRYRWRKGDRTCPQCGAAAIIKGKAEFGGGWLCFKKRGGCGVQFNDDDPAIVAQPTGKVQNDDLHALWNTVLKMAKKRAVVDAVLSATRSSGLFTQDAEDLAEWVGSGNVIDHDTGEVGGARGPIPRWNTTQLMDLLADAGGIPLAALTPALGEKPTRSNLIQLINGWLSRNPGKGLRDLVEDAVDRRRADTAAPVEPEGADSEPLRAKAEHAAPSDGSTLPAEGDDAATIEWVAVLDGLMAEAGLKPADMTALVRPFSPMNALAYCREKGLSADELVERAQIAAGAGV